VVLTLGLTALSAWFLSAAADRRLRALAAEELAEIRTLFLESAGTHEDFERIVQELGALHPTMPLAWRVWSADGSLWDKMGSASLLDRTPTAPSRRHEAHFLAPGIFWSATSLGDGRVVGVVADGTSELHLIRRQQSVIMGMGGLLAVLAILSGVVYARYVSNLLRRVAGGVRSGDLLGRYSVPRAPDEIREVADALADVRRSIRGDIERFRLMVAGLAHEMRSPIQNLLGEAEVALLRDRNAEEYHEVIKSQTEELRELANAVDNLVSLWSAAPDDSSVEEFDLGVEAELRLEKERGAAAKRGVQVYFEVKGDLRMTGDREVLLLALRNVVGNAVAWSPAGGVVHVALGRDDDGLHATVDDQGPGVAPQDRERIFEPFSKGRSVDGGRIGYGLGLALTRKAVEAHGGRVSVGRSPSGGARFHIVLPRPRALRPAERAPAGAQG